MSRGKSRAKVTTDWRQVLVEPMRGRGPLLFSLIVVAAALVFGTLWVWTAVRSHVLDTAEYRFDPRTIVLQPTPDWIAAEDLKREVIRDASLDQPMSMLDDKLVERVAVAFAAHPWVAQVVRVEKFNPARVVVTLGYRKPAAAVAVQSELWPVDREAVLLPRENLAQAELAKLPRIGGIDSSPNARPGNIWQDMRVRQAVLIADAIGGAWNELGVAEVRPVAQAGEAPRTALTYELVLRSGKRILWGRQTSEDDVSEPSPAEKIRRLRSLVPQPEWPDGVTLSGQPRADVPHTATKAAAADPHR